MVTRFIKDVYNLRPVLPNKSSFTSDVGVVINHLATLDINDVNLTHKTATLLALLCGQRPKEILSVMNIRNSEFSDDICGIRIRELLKTSNLRFHKDELKFPDYKVYPCICPVSCIEQ